MFGKLIITHVPPIHNICVEYVCELRKRATEASEDDDRYRHFDKTLIEKKENRKLIKKQI